MCPTVTPEEVVQLLREIQVSFTMLWPCVPETFLHIVICVWLKETAASLQSGTSQKDPRPQVAHTYQEAAMILGQECRGPLLWVIQDWPVL